MELLGCNNIFKEIHFIQDWKSLVNDKRYFIYISKYMVSFKPRWLSVKGDLSVVMSSNHLLQDFFNTA